MMSHLYRRLDDRQREEGAGTPSATGGATEPSPVVNKMMYPPAGTGVAGVCGDKSPLRADARLSGVTKRPGSTPVNAAVYSGDAFDARLPATA